MRNQKQAQQWIVVTSVILLLIAIWGFAGTPVLAQSTATSTPTATATNTPTPTATPIMTQVPLVSNPSGLYYGYGIGNYGAPTPVVAGSAFQSSVGDIDLYSAAGRQTFHVDHATGNVTAYGAIASGGNSTVPGFMVFTPGTVISPTNGGIITATASYQPISSAGTVTVTVAVGTANGYPAGTLLTLVNTSATSIVIQDSGTMMLTGDLTLGQYDTLTLITDGTNWIERAASNN